MKIARVATVPFFLYNHLRGQISATVAAGHKVTLISSDGPEVQLLSEIIGSRFCAIRIPRKISMVHDLAALWKLYRCFRKERFDVVHSTTPKAGMLSAIAAKLAGVPIRLHTFTGQPWVEMRGIRRLIAKAGDWVTATLNTTCYTDSPSQRDFIISEGIVSRDKIQVLGDGSLAGVDLKRFNQEVWRGSRAAILEQLAIPTGYKVIAFIGRLTGDKGIGELLIAYQLLRHKRLKCVLLLIGPEETGDKALVPLERDLSGADIRFIGYSSQPEQYLSVVDIFCLPSYREGFGNVTIEAAAMGIPTVGTNIVGLKDAVIDGVTGLLVPPKDHVALASALEVLINDDKQRIAMGKSARARAIALFDSRKVNDAVTKEYQRLWECMHK
jgi:glycosyltransferase involved in cell wall biosynthesis